MVRVEKDGDGLDLYIASITKDQMTRMEKACAFFGKFYWKKNLQALWYLDTAKMQEIFGVGSFRQMKAGNHRYLGPVLARRSDLEAFVKDIRIYMDDELISVDPGGIRTRFAPTPRMPELSPGNLLVFHGEHYHGLTTYEIKTGEEFSPKQLRFDFVDCGDNGFILQSVSYKGRKYYGVELAQSRGFLRPVFFRSGK